MRLFITVILGLIVQVAFGQKLLPTPRNIQATYDKGTRSTDGKPGKNYWQNTADYDLDIHFDPVTRLLTGTVDINYINNSPDTLRQIWFKLYPNLYKKGSPRQPSILPDDVTDGVSIDSMWMNNQPVERFRIDIFGTNMTFGRSYRLPPGQSVQFRINYHYTLNKHSHLRTGEIEQGAAFIAYFFPRIAVYDDIEGWNRYPYLGNEEFYNDFCHFKVAITVPSKQVVWATGNLLNAKEVLSEKTYQRLQQAEKNDDIITIIDSTEVSMATNQLNTVNTWRFEADNVTDFAFACSDHYMWHSTSLTVDKTTGRRTRVNTAFNQKHKDYFLVIGDARKTVEAMSNVFPKWPFPYPHITVFDGLDQMEYPMMVNDNPVEDRVGSITLTDHEIFHTMFPFYMGINETKYAWMDEGWATIGEWIISPMIDSTIVDDYGVVPTSRNAGNETDMPVMTLSTETRAAYFYNSYPKPAMGYLYVKDYLGDSLFTKALHHYIRLWNGKHPMPNDFFYSMNAGAGRNLNWFWKRWFFDPGIPDLAISSAKKVGNKLTVVISNKGGKPLPIDLKIHFKDGTTATWHRHIGVWEKANSSTTFMIPVSKPVGKLVLSHPHTPDSNPRDNQFVFDK